jgi:hypothetical protein
MTDPRTNPLWAGRLADAELRRLARVKGGSAPVGEAIGPHLLDFFKNAVARRQTRLAQIAHAWEQLVPELLREHSALEGLNRGTLTVLVDSSSHLYDLRQLLLAGLEQQLLLACRSSGLRKVLLKLGRWYEGQDMRDRRPTFQ